VIRRPASQREETPLDHKLQQALVYCWSLHLQD
jgi:hypothetical protein